MGLCPGEARDHLLKAGRDGPDLAELEGKLRIHFRDRSLLVRALTHSSHAHESPDEGLGDNERLEFLGDAVIHLLAARRLFDGDAAAPEGVLTQQRAALVSTGALAAAARGIGLGAYIRAGRGVESSGGRELDSVLANTLEAVFGAVYLDRGLAAAARVFDRLATEGGPTNYKGSLQELTQATGRGTPRYSLVTASGPGHRRHHVVRVTVGGGVSAEGEGATHRAAEQEAARKALAELGDSPPIG